MEYHCRIVDKNKQLQTVVIEAPSEGAVTAILAYDKSQLLVATTQEKMAQIYRYKTTRATEALTSLFPEADKELITKVVILIASGGIKDLTIN